MTSSITNAAMLTFKSAIRVSLISVKLKRNMRAKLSKPRPKPGKAPKMVLSITRKDVYDLRQFLARIGKVQYTFTLDGEFKCGDLCSEADLDEFLFEYERAVFDDFKWVAYSITNPDVLYIHPGEDDDGEDSEEN